MSEAPFSVAPLFIWPPPPPFRSYIPSVWQNLLQLHALRMTDPLAVVTRPSYDRTPPPHTPQLHPLHTTDPPSVTLPPYDRPPFSYLLHTTDPPPPLPLQLHPLCMTPIIQLHPLRMTDPLAVVTPPPSIKPGRTVWLNTRPRWHSEAEESKTFFSPLPQPSSWWCTAMPSLVTKGTDSPHDIPAHGDAPPCKVWLQKVQILPSQFMTSQFMVMHRHAKFGYKRYRFSPWHPSSWWCTAKRYRFSPWHPS